MVLVTGGSGFIGSELARQLSVSGERVRVLDVVGFPQPNPDIEFCHGDIRNRDDVEKSLEGVKDVYHCVALVPLAKAGRKFWEVNVGGTQVLLDQCEKKNVRHIVHISSSAVYGTPECPITEKTPFHPLEIYGRAKYAGERLVFDYQARGGSATIIRPRTVLGDFRLGIFDILFEWIFENRNIYLIGNGQNPFQFVHVADVVSACMQACSLRRTGAYNIGTDRYVTLKADLESFILQVESRSSIRCISEYLAIPLLELLDLLKFSPLAPWHYKTYHKPFYFDISKSVKELEWRPLYSNVDMLVSSYRWFIANRGVSSKTPGSTHHTSPKQKLLKVLKWFS